MAEASALHGRTQPSGKGGSKFYTRSRKIMDSMSGGGGGAVRLRPIRRAGGGGCCPPSADSTSGCCPPSADSTSGGGGGEGGGVLSVKTGDLI